MYDPELILNQGFMVFQNIHFHRLPLLFTLQFI